MSTESVSKVTAHSQVSSLPPISRGNAESAAGGMERRSERKKRTDSRRAWSCAVLGLIFKNLKMYFVIIIKQDAVIGPENIGEQSEVYNLCHVA